MHNININWFPGHMAKALRTVEENLAKVDMIIETCDARIPFSSRNPALENIIGSKPRLLVLNKSDLADEEKTRKWIEKFFEDNITTIGLNGLDRNDSKKLKTECIKICKNKIDKAVSKGRRIRPVRAMVVGIPNTGKSTVINTMAGRKSARTSDKPGVTRALQWVRAGDNFELMDMPGVLWPKIDDEKSQILLSATGAIKDEVIDITQVAYRMMQIVSGIYPENIRKRYKVDFCEESEYEMFEEAARKRGCIMSGGRIDAERFSAVFLDEIRAAKAGRMTFEMP